METGALHIEGVLTPEHGKLETVRLFGGKAQLVECLQKYKKVVCWRETQTSGHYAQGIFYGLVYNASMKHCNTKQEYNT